MTPWIAFTLAAVVFQTVRFMLQKQLASSGLSPAGATFARFLWAAPLVWLAFALQGGNFPAVPPLFWLYAIVGGITQILATICVVALFKSRNFAVGVTLKKTEVLLTAFVGLAILGESISALALAAILTGLAGVLLLTDLPGGKGLQRLANRAAVLGLASGLFFALSGVTYRGASLLIPAEPATRALLTLLVVVTSQVVILGAWLLLREGGEITRVVRGWRRTIWVGLTSVAGSYCWFAGFTLQNAALVYAVGQFEVVLSLLASVLFFREKVSGKELGGIALITGSVLALIAVS
ncbi:EamA-like transporter family protein [Pseudooceanicola antarcticus]|uniref:EamA-like transporter family protein n=1 Tax=Pseudooceanicola antarcticus TaxID=1247613 RepID=A0A285J9Y3_9RHOB|nr:DMT family transporter [Pseudooceanicola antarcticus]PJE30802.1 EamA/RhaT family transporter [Pseudooceanicola antarcticus]SNY57119.1 EamA-like transporter family protein [Pseudooceanicola antarcticus]